ncbi:MAG: MarR family transcriptional regulator [Deltaproteobacteria bacterium]|nr:MAG: MarR family transcriptional regulator [Deltaproteobacteria bacterium]
MPRSRIAPTPRRDAIPLVRAFSRDLARAGGLLSPHFLSSGMPLGEARCLYELGHADGLAISTLARYLELDLGYVSRAVSRLAARRLVTKRVAPGDARARSVVVTDQGRRLIAALDRQMDRRLGAWLAAKPRPEIDRLADGLAAAFGSRDARIAIRSPRPGAIGHIIARHGEFYVAERGYPALFEHVVVQAFSDFVTGFSPPRDRIFVAERGGAFAGSVAVKGRASATAQLRFLLVEPDARGRGLGRRLVQRVIDHARRSGERRIVLDTASDLDAARALYASLGFCRTASVSGEPYLPRGVASEHWELAL